MWDFWCDRSCKGTWKATKIENKVLKHFSLYMAKGWICTLLATSVPASMDKLQLKIEWGGSLRADFQITKNCEFTGTFDVIPKRAGYFSQCLITLIVIRSEIPQDRLNWLKIGRMYKHRAG